MARQAPVTFDDDAPELTDAELAEMRPARGVMTEQEFAAVSSVRRGRPKAEAAKVPVTIRLDRAVVEAFKATGKGWQTRINETLAAAVTADRLHASPVDRAAAAALKRGATKRAGPKVA